MSLGHCRIHRAIAAIAHKENPGHARQSLQTGHDAAVSWRWLLAAVSSCSYGAASTDAPGSGPGTSRLSLRHVLGRCRAPSPPVSSQVIPRSSQRMDPRPALFVASNVPQSVSNFFGEQWKAAPGRSQNWTSDRREPQTNGHNSSRPMSETSSSGLGSFALRDRGQRGIGLPPYRSKSIAGFNSATIAWPSSTLIGSWIRYIAVSSGPG
jgi:hypothetical protein